MKENKHYISEKSLYPIHMAKQILISRQNNKYVYFSICTIDRVFFIYSYEPKNENKFNLKFQKVLKSTACDIFFDKQNSNLYLGLFSGDIKIVSYQQNIFKLQNQPQYSQNVKQKQQLDNHIQLLYTQSSRLYVWRGHYQVLIINKNNMQLKGKYKFSIPITSCISFISPNNYNNLGCISFLNNKPPILFNCEDINQFQTIYIKCCELYDENDVKQQQIVKMAFQKKSINTNYLLCGNKNIYKGTLSVYIIKENQQQIQYCQRLYKVFLQNQPTIQHIHICDGNAIITLWDNILIFNVQRRKSKGKSTNLGKRLSWGFIIKVGSKGMTFILIRGFNYKYPQLRQKKKNCFHQVYQEYKY